MAGNTVYVQGSYVDVHDNEVVNLSIEKATVKVGENGAAVSESEAGAEEGEQPVPEALRGEQAKRIVERLVGAGLLNQAWQPVGLSRPQAAIVADCVAEQLQIRNKWKTFEQLWHRNNLRNDYNPALSECGYYDDFRKKLMRIIR